MKTHRQQTRHASERLCLPAFILIAACRLLSPHTVFAEEISQTEAREIAPEKNIAICFFYLDPSLDDHKTSIEETANSIPAADAGILTFILAGLKDEAQLSKISADLPKMSFSRIVKGHDPDSHLAMLSSVAPAEFNAITDRNYAIRDGIRIPVMRGFMHAIINIDGYVLHIIGADLKDREKHPEFNQTDMRRYEARKLRQIVNEIQKNDISANILIMGSLNDTCGKSPIKDIYNRRFGINKRLFDLRPTDKLSISWTHMSPERDVYERIDYAIASSALIPEVDYDKLRIIDIQCQKTSIRRPILVHVSTKDRPLWSNDKVNQVFPYTIRTP